MGAYLNLGGGSDWLTCGDCETPLMELEDGMRLVDMVDKAKRHVDGCDGPGPLSTLTVCICRAWDGMVAVGCPKHDPKER